MNWEGNTIYTVLIFIKILEVCLKCNKANDASISNWTKAAEAGFKLNQVKVNHQSYIPGIVRHSSTYIANLKVLPHEEVEGGTGVGSDGAYAAAAAPQQSQAQISTLLRFLLKEQLRKLHGPREKLSHPARNSKHNHEMKRASHTEKTQ